MLLEIDVRSPVPVYEQIVAQIQRAVAEGGLEPEAPLPPIRQLAKDLDLNPATVAKAYLLLEKDGIVRTAGRRGTFVRGDARPKVGESLRREAADQIREVGNRWVERGLSSRDLRRLFNEFLSTLDPKESHG
jgi:GntR family transcriptional regulator